MSRSNGVFPTVRTEGGLLPADLLARIAAGDKELEGLAPDDYHLAQGERLHEVIIRSWNRLVAAWSGFRSAIAKLPPEDAGTSVTRERWLLILFQELGYGRVAAAHGVEIEGKSYPISHLWQNVPIHLVGAGVDLDRRTAGVAGAARTSPHGLVQEYLNRSKDHLWGFVSNGLRLRILRDNASLTRQAYVEFDLEAMMEGQAYADFVLLWLLCHESRVDAERPEDCWLERWMRFAREQGTRALDNLRAGVEQAITALGSGFLAHPGNTDLLRRLRAGELSTQDYYRQLLRLVYRLIFLFVAEDRGLLLDPHAPAPARQRYLRYYAASRLRRLAEHVRGTRHPDLYRSLRVVMDRLGSDAGCPELGLPALGSFLWSRAAIPDLAEADIANCDFLEAIRALSFTVQERVRRVVDYKNLGSEELGSIYESLLELHPDVNTDTAAFELKVASGHERKTTGSYYTPSSLIQSLLDSALDPVLDDAVRSAGAGRSGEGTARTQRGAALAQGGAVKAVGEAAMTSEELAKTPEEAILSVKVCDPACGSGHFLIAAAHRIARRLAQIRTGDEEPSPEATRSALRDVIGHCIYGVDMNPMAVELCKVSLWMEALEPGKPLSFLDHRILCGNSLLGATPALLREGIPDDAFKAIEGDDKKLVTALRRQNREERDQPGLAFQWGDEVAIGQAEFGEAISVLDSIGDSSIQDIHSKEIHYQSLGQSSAYRQAKLAADAWCAAFVWKKAPGAPPAITNEIFRRIREGGAVSASIIREIERLTAQYHFFHWHLAFPDVFQVPVTGDPSNPQAGWSGGFDVVLGNPPWERVKLQEQEWFAARRPDIANAPNAAARQRLIDGLAQEDLALHTAFLEARRQAEGESHFVRDSGRYPLCGRGDVNTYAIFAETMRTLAAPKGRVGAIVPSGIATDDTTKFFFRDIVDKRSLVSLYDFENRKGLFPAVDSRMKFCLLTMTGPARPAQQGAEFAFFAHDTEDLEDEERRFTLSADDIALLNPNTRTCPIFRSKRDAEITKGIYQRVPVLIKEGPPEENPWGVSFVRMFDMAVDSGLFRTREQLELEGWVLDGNVFYKSGQGGAPGKGGPGGAGQTRYLPLYEAKMIHHFDHRWATYERQDTRDLTDAEKADPDLRALPRYWVPEEEVEARLERRDRDGNLIWSWDRDWLMGWRDICRSTDERTVIASIMPRVGVGNNIPLMILGEPHRGLAGCLLSDLASFVHDYTSRQKTGGTHLNFFIYEQLPVLPPKTYSGPCPWSRDRSLSDWLSPRVLELVYTAWDLQPFARDMGYDGPPFRWDDERRFLLRCELDAAFFHLYGVSREDTDYILDTFPIVKQKDERRFGEYRTKRVILQCYDAMREAMEAGREYQTILDPPPADERVAHPSPAVRADMTRFRLPDTTGAAARALEAATAVAPPAEPSVTLEPPARGAELLPFRRVQPRPGDRYKTCVPLVSLKAAAGGFGNAQAVETEDWVEVKTSHRLRQGMFVAQVVGHSMEPRIPDGAWCLFAAPVIGSPQGRIVLVQHRDIYDPETGGSYTIKRYRSQKTLLGDKMASDEGTWRHSVIYLEPLNPDYQPIVLKDVEEGEVRVIAEFVEVLGGAGTF